MVWLAMKPEPPVTRTVLIAVSLGLSLMQGYPIQGTNWTLRRAGDCSGASAFRPSKGYDLAFDISARAVDRIINDLRREEG